MVYDKFYNSRPKIPYNENFYVLDYKHMDINGDSVKDDVYLVGKTSNLNIKSIFNNITLVVCDGKTNSYCAEKLKFNQGYNPIIKLQAIEPNIINIIILLDSRHKNNTPFHYIYVFKNNKLIKVYDYEENQNTRESNADNIDFSQVQPMYSETERDLKLEEAIRSEYVLGDEGVRYYYNRIDLNDDGVPEVFVYLTGKTVCCQVTGACQVAIFQVEDDKYKLLSKVILIDKPFVITDEKTNGYKDIILKVHGGAEGDFYVRVKYDGKTYPEISYIQPKVESGAKIKGISVISDNFNENPGLTII